MESVTDTLPTAITVRPRLPLEHADPGFAALAYDLGLAPGASRWTVDLEGLERLLLCFGMDVDPRDMLDLLRHVSLGA